MHILSSVALLACIAIAGLSPEVHAVLDNRFAGQNRRLLQNSGSSSFASASSVAGVNGQLSTTAVVSGQGQSAATASNGTETVSVSLDGEAQMETTPITAPRLSAIVTATGSATATATVTSDPDSDSDSLEELASASAMAPGISESPMSLHSSTNTTTSHMYDTCENGVKLPNDGVGTISNEICCRCPFPNSCTGYCSCQTGECTDSLLPGWIPMPYPKCEKCADPECSQYWWCT